MSRHFSIWIVTPPNYLHSRCFEEMALGLQAAFAALGFDAPIVTDPVLIRDWAVVLGANLLHAFKTVPPRLILYNLEQVQEGSEWFHPLYLALLKRYPVWDYSSLNIAKLGALGIKATLCGVGYMPCLIRIPPTAEDIDVLFIGTMSDRRKAILGQIAQTGKNVTAAINLYGSERDALIARAKIVLNMHFYEAQLFEIIRVSYLLANRKCVVSETGRDEELEAPLRGGIAFAPYQELTATCLRLLNDNDERARLRKTGFEHFSALSQVPMLAQALTSLPSF